MELAFNQIKQTVQTVHRANLFMEMDVVSVMPPVANALIPETIIALPVHLMLR